ncbi:MAG: acyl carrier protein [Hyphomicrobiaceae bacterium]
MDSVGSRIRDIVSRHLGVPPEKITESARFIEDLGADSLDTLELLIIFEEAFGCEVPDEAAESIHTVGDAQRYLEAKVKT